MYYKKYNNTTGTTKRKKKTNPSVRYIKSKTILPIKQNEANHFIYTTNSAE